MTLSYRWTPFILLVITWTASSPAWCDELSLADSSPPSRIDFGRDVHRIFASRCLKCHGPGHAEAELNLSDRETALNTGAIVPGEPDQSTLLERVTAEDESVRMPPEGKPLSRAEVALLGEWIRSGAPWSGHWAYQPLAQPPIPTVSSESLRNWCRTPIDHFIAARLESEQINPAAEADRRTLLRRASFDLCGVPPTPEEVDDFLNDASEKAWEKCIERLLASPRYGERWARHWMDLVHFAETHGHDQDRPREHAWPYRDYLIQSFNSDKPYDRFVVEQIAGDITYPEDPDAIAATGFLAAGPWDESSLRDIREDSVDRVIGQYLDRDDVVTTVMSTFTSTSVQCARCHDHKFDPITQQDYYGLQAVFAGIDKANRPYDRDPVIAGRRQSLKLQQEQLTEIFRRDPESLLSPQLTARLQSWEEDYRGTRVSWQPLLLTSFHSQGGATLQKLDDASLLAEGPRPDKDVYLVEGTVAMPTVTAVRLEVLSDPSLPSNGPGRQDNGNLHLNEIRIFQMTDAPTGQMRELRSATPHADFNQDGWAAGAAIDQNPNTAWGIFPEVGKSHFVIFPLQQPVQSEREIALRIELHQIHGGGHLIGRFRLTVTGADPQVLAKRREIPSEITSILAMDDAQRSPQQRTILAFWYLNGELESELATLPPPALVYCGTSQFQADGSFRPAVTPRVVHVLNRGQVTEPGEEAVPRAFSCLAGLSPELAIENPAREGERRRVLARWIADPSNPLTWRSIANRVWLYHFGRGLVETPNDFGHMGAYPTHPQLLDWLAGAGIRNGTAFGRSDDFGYEAVEDVTYGYDLHATILHLMGIDHKRLTFRHNGLDRRLTDVHGHLIREILS